jgi:hypothetical protein
MRSDECQSVGALPIHFHSEPVAETSGELEQCGDCTFTSRADLAREGSMTGAPNLPFDPPWRGKKKPRGVETMHGVDLRRECFRGGIRCWS